MEQTAHAKMLVVGTAKHTAQNTHQCAECFPLGVDKLEMYKGNAHPVLGAVSTTF